MKVRLSYENSPNMPLFSYDEFIKKRAPSESSALSDNCEECPDKVYTKKVTFQKSRLFNQSQATGLTHDY